jgi:thymidylate kinase
MTNKEQAITKLNTSLDKALERAENKKTRKLEKEINYFLSNVKTKMQEIKDKNIGGEEL